MITNARVGEIRSWPKNNYGWHVSPGGNGVTLGDSVTLGDGVKLGDEVKLGDRVTLGDWVTSTALNQQFRQSYIDAGPEHVFYKWVTRDRMSPGWGNGTPIKYDKGAVIECPEAVVSDQQCGVGLHVFRFGYRPEWAGLCDNE